MSSLIGIGGGGNVGASGSFYGYSIDQSLRFEDGDDAYLSRTPSSAGNRQTWTVSFWVKFENSNEYDYFFSCGSTANETWLRKNNDGTIQFQTNGGINADKTTSAVYRDVSSWYHILMRFDSTDSTSADRTKLYVNGVLQTWSGNNASSNESTQWNNNTGHRIGERNGTGGNNFSGYIAEFYNIDGTALDPTSFGETSNGVWVPKAYSGSYGTNGFYLSFADSAAIGDDLSGNTNDFTATNVAASDVVLDSPTNNFATWNVTGIQYGGTNAPTVSEGSLKAATSGNPTHIYSTFAIQPTDTQGYYWEVKAISLDTARSYMGIVAPEGGASGASIGSYQFRYKFVLNMNDDLYGDDNSAGGGTVNLTSWTTNDILMFAYKDGKFWIGKNGTWMNSGDPAGGTGDLVAADGGRPSDRGDVTWYPYVGFNSTYTANFGQDSTFAGTETAGGNSDENGVGDFKYSVPSGFLALASSSLPEPAIGPNSDTTSDQNFNTVLYTGNASTNAITGVNFAPDWVWLKARSFASGHALFDVVRGALNYLGSQATTAESALSASLTSFDSDGFSLGSNNGVNRSGTTFVSWNWKAGGTAVSNTDGTNITSSVSANPDAGFSIVSWTGTGVGSDSVGHGLTQKPEMVICKARTSAGVNYWHVNHKDLTASDYNLFLNLTSAETDVNTNYAEGGIGLGDANVIDFVAGYSGANNVANCNNSGSNYIAYCFHSVEGFSKVGKYFANNNANGPFIYTGFRPAWVMVKNTDNGSVVWWILDNKRSTFNVMNDFLYPGTSNSETDSTVLFADFLSNGFKIRNATYGETNAAAGNDFVYLAFAEAPFKYANAR